MERATAELRQREEETRYWAERQAKLDKLAAFRREYEAVQRERRFYTKCIVANHAAVL